MALNPPEAGLHRLRYDSKSVAKVQLAVQPGDELVVSDDVAKQLVAADPHFKPVDEPPAATTAPAKPPAKPRGRARKSAK